MSSTRIKALGFSVVLAVVAGCASPSAEGDSAVASSASDITVSGTKFLGKLANGDSRVILYDANPEYRAFSFDASGGDTVYATVASLSGDAVAWITDDRFNILSVNDDADGTSDSLVTYTVPFGAAPATYRIVFREYSHNTTTFQVKLAVTSALSSATCSYGSLAFHVGRSFPSADGCNTCTCGAGGIFCTKDVCACDPSREPQHDYKGNPEQCQTISFECGYDEVPFSNDCGCGCARLP